jgi:hypothetical protein
VTPPPACCCSTAAFSIALVLEADWCCLCVQERPQSVGEAAGHEGGQEAVTRDSLCPTSTDHARTWGKKVAPTAAVNSPPFSLHNEGKLFR